MEDKNEYLKCFGITCFLLKMTAISPLIFWDRASNDEATKLRKPELFFNFTGTSKWPLFSRTMSVISIGLYLFVLPQHLTFMALNVRETLDNFNFNILIRILPTLTVRIVVLSMPFVTWGRRKLLHRHWGNWKEFQTDLEQVTGTELSLPTKLIIRWVPVSVVFVIITLSVVMRSYYHKNANASPSYPSAIHAMGTSLLFGTYWYANCLFVRSLATELQRVIKEATRNLEEERFRKATQLWLKLCDLNEQFDAIHSPFFLVAMSALVVNMVASIYSFLYVIIYEESKLVGFSHLAYTFFTFLSIEFFCESSNSVFNSIVNRVNDTLLDQKTTHMDAKLLRAILVFLQLMETKKPAVTLSKMVVLDRSAVVSILAAVVNYLIVMKQFATMKYQGK